MGKIRFFCFVILCIPETAGEENLPVQDNAVLTIERPESDFAVEINYLNGTWGPEWSYNVLLGMTEEERVGRIHRGDFSWGEGKLLGNSTFLIVTTAEGPFVVEPTLGIFGVTNMIQTGINSMEVSVFRPTPYLPPEIVFAFEFIFCFIDRDIVWIEAPAISGWRNEFLHRISGPTRGD